MAVVTELQAELLAALLNSGVSSDTIIQALKAGERSRPDYPKLEKLVNGTNEEQGTNYAAGIALTEVQDVSTSSSITDLETSGQSIAEQLMRNDPWQSAKIIKQYMQQHNIPQREAVETTGLNQSHLSQHLNKGTPMKTQKRMTLYKWFEAKQREVAAQYNSTSGKRLAEHDINSPHFTGTPSYKRARRNRFKWGQASTEILYQAYESQRNPSKDEREALVQACNRAECEQRGIPLEQVNNLGPNLVTESRVYNWFANRRKEEAFKVKLAMDAGTYPVSIVGPGGVELGSTPESKITPTTNEKLTMVTKSPLPTLVSHPITKLANSIQTVGDVSPRTPIPATRLPPMSLVKCEQSPATPLSQTPTLPYAHQISQNAPAVLQRPISVAFGAMPPQILTPAQLQVITGLMPGQMVPTSHAATGLIGQLGEITTAGALPSGHVTNLMLPGQLGTQPIPMHAVTLMSMSGGTPQVFYSMPGHSPVLPVPMANVVTTSSAQFPVSSHLAPAAGTLSTAPTVQIANQSTVTESNIQRQSPLLMPQISSVHGAGSPGQLPGTGSTSLSNQIYSQMILPVAGPFTGQSQSPQTTTVRPALTTKSEVSRVQLVSGVPLPSISQLGTSRVQTPTSTTPFHRVPCFSGDHAIDDVKRVGGLATADTLVVEMKPVESSEGVTGSKSGESPDVTPSLHAVTLAPETGEKVNGDDFKEPTLTLSEEGVVALGEDKRNGNEVDHPTVQAGAIVQMVETVGECVPVPVS